MGWKPYKRLDLNPMTGKMEWMWVDTSNPGTVGIVETDFSIDPIVERNKARYAMTDERARWKDGGEVIGEVPMSIFWDLWKRSHGFKDQTVMKRWINDKDNRHFLTRPVKL